MQPFPPKAIYYLLILSQSNWAQIGNPKEILGIDGVRLQLAAFEPKKWGSDKSKDILGIRWCTMTIVISQIYDSTFSFSVINTLITFF